MNTQSLPIGQHELQDRKLILIKSSLHPLSKLAWDAKKSKEAQDVCRIPLRAWTGIVTQYELKVFDQTMIIRDNNLS